MLINHDFCIDRFHYFSFNTDILLFSTYDLCSILSSRFNVNGQLSCPPQLEKQNLPCTCPIQAGTYTLNPDVWTIPPLRSFLSFYSSVRILKFKSHIKTFLQQKKSLLYFNRIIN